MPVVENRQITPKQSVLCQKLVRDLSFPHLQDHEDMYMHVKGYERRVGSLKKQAYLHW